MRKSLIGKNILGYSVTEVLGSGVFGTVYKAVKENPSGSYTRALKYISIPNEEQYYTILNSMGGDIEKTNEYFKNILNGIVTEVQVLNDFSEKDIPNVVRYYENDIQISEDPLHYDIFILMEYLTPLTEYLTKNKVQVKDIIYLGLDILDGLASSHKNGVIHRDVKIDNIFVTQDGNEFKIGDFGVSKVLDGSTKAESLKGTPDFIAPEVYLGKEGYNKSVDLYSLGIVLYRLLNYNRNPFLPPYPQQYLPEDEDLAFERRMKEEQPELPALGGEAIGKVILKAISNNKERYQSAIDFYDALEIAAYQTSDEDLNQEIDLTFPIPEKEEILEESFEPVNENSDKREPVSIEPNSLIVQESLQKPEVVESTPASTAVAKPKKGKRIWKILAALIVLIIVAAGSVAAYVIYNNQQSKPLKSPTFTVSGGEYDSPQSVQIQSDNPDASIYYTIDGSTPSEKSKKYNEGEDIKIDKTTTLKSIVLGNNGQKSPVTSVTYTIKSKDDSDLTGVADNSNSTGSPKNSNTKNTQSNSSSSGASSTGTFNLKASPATWSFTDAIMSNNYTASASSALADAEELNYSPANVLDNNAETAWIEGIEGDTGIGEKITLTYTQSDPTNINNIYIMDGYTKSDKIFKMNTTPTTLKVQKNGTDLGTINLEVIADPQQVRLPEPITLNLGDSISFEIVDVKTGPNDVDYDTCISEIRLVN